jgi:hypothetical protein
MIRSFLFVAILLRVAQRQAEIGGYSPFVAA